MPHHAAELRFQAGNAEPYPAIVLDGGGAFDPATASRHVDHACLDAAFRAVAHGRAETQRKPFHAAALVLDFSRLSHAFPYLNGLHARDW
jgi:hypothetical protein